MNQPSLNPTGKKRVRTATRWDDFLNQELQDPQLKQAWDEDAPLRELQQTLIALRIEHNLTQKELAQKLQTHQTNISKLETGQANPSLKFLSRVAASFGKTLHLQFW